MPQAQQLACWASTVDVFKILKSDPSVVGVDLVVDDIDVGGASDRIINGLLGQSSGPLMLSLINSLIQAVLSDLSTKCLTAGSAGASGESSAHNEPSTHWWWSEKGMTAGGYILLGCLLTVVGLAVWSGRKFHQDKVLSDDFRVNDDYLEQFSESLGDRERHYIEERNSADSTARENSIRMITHRSPNMSRFISALMSVLILGNMALFLWSNLSIGANVNLLIAAGSEHISPNQPVFQFSLGDTVHDMWQAGVYPLAILIAFFSGA
eukprot:gene28233-50054_t